MMSTKLPTRWAIFPRAFLALFLFSAQLPLFAGEGHSHDAAPAAASGPALPRFTAHSDLLEAVGVLDADALSILIDRYDSNEPVLNAQVTMASGSLKSVLAFHGDQGDYSAPATPFKQPGTYPITLTVIAGDLTDLLAGELVVPDPDAAHANEAPTTPWGLWSGLAAALLAVAAAVAWRVRRSGAHNNHPTRL